ncbi:D-beta-hydroxybutyrate dehydrogenase [Marinobacterium lacunae]|uniref:D-beta-hydroxybutyrate dehydrogenase n=1 Tax=Marinobacterium lacunae TaxID=1232683 RepID=A0A081FUQ8_9GAMM|nr:NAD(P)-dependent oxidoreductase [Marinobacterium lacunae]KEA62263.1 D-beta-hydroxybutyrate dehydrogenase [Marinobacterium lacunae]
MTTIAFAGLGAMGMPMAKNILAAGFKLRGIDLNTRALEALREAGAEPAHSASEAASGADVIVLMVVNAQQAEQVLFEQGALDALRPGGTVCLMATCSPGAVEQIATRVEATGRRFADAPVSGGVVGAQAGTLTIMAACGDETYAELLPLFQAMGERIFHVGDKPGQGAVVKTVNQLLCGVHIAVVAEAFSLAAKVGVDLGVLLEIMSGSAAASWMLRDRGPRMLEREPDVTSAVDIFVKDLGIVLEAGREAQAALPLAATAHQLFLSTSGRGEGRADDSQVIRSYHLLNGVE